MNKEKRVVVEFGDGFRRGVWESKLPQAFAKAEELKKLAIEAGRPKEEAECLFSLRIVSQEE